MLTKKVLFFVLSLGVSGILNPALVIAGEILKTPLTSEEISVIQKMSGSQIQDIARGDADAIAKFASEKGLDPVKLKEGLANLSDEDRQAFGFRLILPTWPCRVYGLLNHVVDRQGLKLPSPSDAHRAVEAFHQFFGAQRAAHDAFGVPQGLRIRQAGVGENRPGRPRFRRSRGAVPPVVGPR